VGSPEDTHVGYQLVFPSFVRRYWKVHVKAWLDDFNDRKDKDAFRVNGTQIYIGRQGSGKTISAVRHLLEIKERWPKAIVVTNLQLNVPWPYVTFSTADELAELLVNTNNDKFGVIYLIDEIHTYFNALDSMNIPPYVFTEISQQRKQRKTIIGTSQLFMRMAKPLREQCDNIVSCKTWFGIWTFNRVYDGMTVEQDFDGKLIGDIKKRGFFWHSRELRRIFDTYQKVVSSSSQKLEFESPERVTKEMRKGRRRSY